MDFHVELDQEVHRALQGIQEILKNPPAGLAAILVHRETLTKLRGIQKLFEELDRRELPLLAVPTLELGEVYALS